MSYLFTATPNTDVTTALQSALDTYKDVSIDNSYLISAPLTIPDYGSLSGSKLGILKAAETRTGLLNTQGNYIVLSGKQFVSIRGIKFQPASNMVDGSGYGFAACVIFISAGSKSCIVEKCYFDFNYAYDDGMDAIFITGEGTNNNAIIRNYCKTVGICYSADSASYNSCSYNQVVDSQMNSIFGMGNNGNDFKAYDNKVLYNTIQNAGRMGIEEIQKITGTQFIGNSITGTGKHPYFAANAQGMGISVVAENSIVQGNITRDVKSYHIEVRGRAGHRILYNDIYDNGVQEGIHTSFSGSISSDKLHQTTLLEGNKIQGCRFGIVTHGTGIDNVLDVLNNTIIDSIERQININVESRINNHINVSNNSLYYTEAASALGRTAIMLRSALSSVGGDNSTYIVRENTITYEAPEAGVQYDTTFHFLVDNVSFIDNAILANYGGNKLTPFTTYMARTGFKISGNRISGGNSYNFGLLATNRVNLDLGILETNTFSKGNPTNAENETLFFTDRAILLTKLVSSVRGTSPSVTWNIVYGATRNAAGTKVFAADQVANSLSGTQITSFTNALIPANSFVWLTTSAASGTVLEFANVSSYKLL